MTKIYDNLLDKLNLFLAKNKENLYLYSLSIVRSYFCILLNVKLLQ